MDNRTTPLNRKLFGLRIPTIVIVVCVFYVLALLVFFLLIGLLPKTTNIAPTLSPTKAPTLSMAPTTPTLSPTKAPTLSITPTTPTLSPTKAPTISIAPTISPSNPCICSNDNQPIYDNPIIFKHPLHTDESFAVFNFYNDNATDTQGNNLTVWITIESTADGQMSPKFKPGFHYIYVDAHELKRGESFSYTLHKDTTANGHMGGGRILIYYEDPNIHDIRRTRLYGSPLYGNGTGFPVQSPGNIVSIEENGVIIDPSQKFRQLLEFTLDFSNGDNPDTQAFFDYDLSCVDEISLPVLIMGERDPRTLPNATQGNLNNGFPCGRAYIGCQTIEETHRECPTQIEEETIHGKKCVASFPYCSRNITLESDDPSGLGIQNKTHWMEYCHQWDHVAAAFGITQQKINFWNQCASDGNTNPPCPFVLPPVLRTPTAAIYGCVGQFLLENHCIPSHKPFQTQMDGSQCSALNRGLCFEPDYNHIPNEGLSCAIFSCQPQQPLLKLPLCFLPCNDSSCFGDDCSKYLPLVQDATCIKDNIPQTCSLVPIPPHCQDYEAVISKTKTSTCNDSTPMPYEQRDMNNNLLLRNNYSQWVRNKGQRFYGFSLDEEIGGGNQQCLFSTQLDIVIFPTCGGNAP
jgi:hypothetical protein